MRRIYLASTILLALAIGGIWLSCSQDNTVVPTDQPLSIEGDEGAALFEWAIGPIDGITSVWHPTPREITVPVGTTLRFKCGSAHRSGMSWSNAREVSQGDLESIAECHIDTPGRQEISVAVVGGRTREDRIQEYSDDPVGGGDDRAASSFRRTCIVNGVDVGINHVGVVSLEPRVEPLMLTELSSNYETMKAFRVGNKISQLLHMEWNHYCTAVDRPVALGATLSDPRFASIIETRISGERPILGAEAIEIEKPGRYTVSVGPPTRARSFLIETYKVSITSHQRGRDVVRDGEPVTFAAKTDPPGHEDEITWISSTRYGEAHPVVGHGSKFTVEFQGTARGDSWLGVRADNAAFTQDQDTQPQLALKQLTIDMDDVVTPFSEWGHAELTFTGTPAILYFNLSVNGQWPIRNMPVQSVEGIGVLQGVSFDFDLDVSPGTQVTSVNAGWNLTTVPLVSMPTQTGSFGVTQLYFYEYYGGLGDVIATYSAPPLLIGGQAQEAQKHNHQNFPNQECGKCKCIPVAVSNSLKFLKARHNLNIPDAAITPAQMETATGWNTDPDIPHKARLLPLNQGYWHTKDAYMQANSLPITTTSTFDIDCVIKAIDKGCDVEMNGGGHTAAIVGVTKLGNDKYTITVKHDVKQGQDGGTGDEGTQSGTYDKGTNEITGGIQWFNNHTVNNFVIECPTGVDPGC